MPDSFAFGDFTISRIVEVEKPLLDKTWLLPDWSEDAVQPHLDWLVPRHYEPATGLLVIVLQSFVIKSDRCTILVDTCVGNDKPRNREMFNEATFPWMDNFTAAGVTVEEIDYVLCTHLHVDHVGWNTRLVDNVWVPTFPNAKYIFARTELEYWLAESDGGRMERTGDYVADSVLPILEAKQDLVVDMDHEIDTGIRLVPLPGHTPGQVGLEIDGPDGAKMILTGDMMHHMIQCHIPDWSSTPCADQDAARVTRKKFLDATAETGTIVIPAHFPGPTAGTIRRAGDGFAFDYLGE